VGLKKTLPFFCSTPQNPPDYFWFQQDRLMKKIFQWLTDKLGSWSWEAFWTISGAILFLIIVIGNGISGGGTDVWP
jgi:hypothetical protein